MRLEQTALSPTPTERLLLRACLLSDGRALEAYQQWCRAVELEAVDDAGYRMLSLLYSNLQRLGVDDARQAKLAGIYRHLWIKQQRMWFRAAAVLGRLEMPLLLLKGAALGPMFYEHVAARRMGDVDVLVRPQDAEEAIRLLVAAGFQPVGRPLRWITPAYRAVVQAQPFSDGAGGSIDLHWRSLYVVDERIDATFWQHAVPLTLAGWRGRTLCAEHHLLHVCLHAAYHDENRPLRWVADCVRIIEACPGLRWDFLVRDAQRWPVAAFQLRRCLMFLARELEVPVPADVTAQLARPRLPRGERRLLQLAAVPDAQRSLAQNIVLLTGRFLRSQYFRDSRRPLMSLLEFSKAMYMEDTVAGVWRRLWQRLRNYTQA